jgi:CRISPR-associated protein Cas1
VKGDDIKKEFTSSNVEQIHLLNSGDSISIDAIRLALENQILIVIGNMYGWPYGFVIPASLSGTIRGKREQFVAYNDKRGVNLSKQFVYGKSRNQRNLLNLLKKNRRGKDVFSILSESSEKIKDIINELDSVDGNRIDDVRTTLLNIEARASKEYWKVISELLPQQINFTGRKTRGATDPFNSMLNFGYKAILFVECWKAIYYAGLDPYAGFLHADRAGKPSLVLDFMEEFRQQTVDRVLLTLINKDMLELNEIMETGENGQQRLNKQVLRIISENMTDQLNSKMNYGKERLTLQNIIQIQANHLVRYLRGSDEYRPFELRW